MATLTHDGKREWVFVCVFVRGGGVSPVHKKEGEFILNVKFLCFRENYVDKDSVFIHLWKLHNSNSGCKRM